MSVDVTAKTKLLGVLGTPIEHSSSPKIHNTAFEALGLDYEYLAFDVGPETLGQAIEGLRALGAGDSASPCQTSRLRPSIWMRSARRADSAVQ